MVWPDPGGGDERQPDGSSGGRHRPTATAAVTGHTELDAARVRLLGRPVREPAALLRALRDVPAGARRRRRRHGQLTLRRLGRPVRGARRRSGSDGRRDHSLHGCGVGRAPEPCGQHRLRAAARLPLATGARLHRRTTARRGPGDAPAGGRPRQAGQRRSHAPGPRDLHPQRDGVGDHPHHRSGQHHSRRVLGRAAAGPDRRHRRRQLHRPGRPVGLAGQRRLHEPRPLPGTGPRPERLDVVVGLPARPRSRERSSRRGSPSSCGAPVADAAARMPRKERWARPGGPDRSTPAAPRPRLSRRRHRTAERPDDRPSGTAEVPGAP